MIKEGFIHYLLIVFLMAGISFLMIWLQLDSDWFAFSLVMLFIVALYLSAHRFKIISGSDSVTLQRKNAYKFSLGATFIWAPFGTLISTKIEEFELLNYLLTMLIVFPFAYLQVYASLFVFGLFIKGRQENICQS